MTGFTDDTKGSENGGETVIFPEHICCIRFMAEWTINEKLPITQTQQDIHNENESLCDLDLKIFCYDDRARFIEKLDGSNSISKDSSCELISDIEATDATKDSYFELAKVNLSKVDPSTTAILFYLDGGSRNFSLVNKLNCTCRHTPNDRKDESSTFTLASYQNEKLLACEKYNTIDNGMKRYDGVALCLLYKAENQSDDSFNWTMKVIFEPVLCHAEPSPTPLQPLSNNLTMKSSKSSKSAKGLSPPIIVPIIHKSKFDICLDVVIKNIPALSKFKPRLFSNVRDVCSALSSQALPNLKKQFQQSPKGLPISTFTKVIFNQLATTHPSVMEESEAASTVALIQEMFQQIDYNGDHFTDWDEFTTFCIQTGVVNQKDADEDEKNDKNGVEEISITYCEDAVMRDRMKMQQRHIFTMKYLPGTHRIALVSDSDYICIYDEQFRQVSKFSPLNIQIQDTLTDSVMMPNDKKVPFQIYDVVHLPSRDMFAFCMSDHSIVVTKEQITLGGLNIKYTCYNRLYHMLLQQKLCWSESAKVLCSVCSDYTIYGWDIDLNNPIFQIVRHTDVITDFIAADHLDMFITCSMDKRIMCWSASSRRVKCVLLGHNRGVRTLSCYENTLLSAGFESEARLWDIKKKEPVAILKGHRFPIVVVKLMCDKALTDREQRAVTIDEQGEFRLWDIFVSERLGECVYVPTLQVFSINNPETPLSEVKFIAFPYNPTYTVGYYSNIIACSTKLLHFNPEKNVKDFLPPTCSCFNESQGVLATAVGKDIVQYDICSGTMINTLSNVHTSEITAVCLDGTAGRRLYVGCSNGELLLINFMSGSVISLISNAHNKEIVNISMSPQTSNGMVCVYTAAADGRICLIDETSGQLSLRNSIDCAFGEGVAIQRLKYIDYANAIIATSNNKQWGVWTATSLKKVVLVREYTRIHAVEVVNLYKDVIRYDQSTKIQTNSSNDQDASNSVTKIFAVVAIAGDNEITLYSIDFSKMTAVPFVSTRSGTQYLYYANHISTIVCLEALKSLNVKTMNHQAENLIAAYEDGTVQVWDIFAFLDTTKKISRRATTRYSILKGSSKSLALALTPAMSQTDFSNNNSSRSIESSSLLNSGRSAMSSESIRSVNAVNIDKSITSFWTGHNDQISSIVPLHDHDSFVTVSLDGYHKIWASASYSECLGEIALPNITDAMKEKYLSSNLNGYKGKVNTKGRKWKFILDRTPVTPEQKNLARLLVNQFLNPKLFTMSNNRRSNEKSSTMRPIIDKVIKVNDFSKTLTKHSSSNMSIGSTSSSASSSMRATNDSDQAEAHMQAMKSLARSHALLSLKDSRANDFSNHHIGASMIEHGIAGGSMSDSTDFSMTKSRTQLEPIENGSHVTLNGDSTSNIAGGLGGTSNYSSLLSKRTKDAFVPLWSTSQELVGLKGEKTHKAFSETSLAQGRSTGIIGSHEYAVLRGLSNDPTKIQVYNSSTPVLFLRNPKLTTSLKVPKLSEVTAAEVSFGSQSELFRNAEKYLNDRGKKAGCKEQELRAIVMGRIEMNVKRVGEMIHREATRSHEEILLPSDNDQNHSKHEEDEKDEQKMGQRLMQSAMLVPLELSEKKASTVLDKARLNKIVSQIDEIIDNSSKIEHTVGASKLGTLSGKKVINVVRDNLEHKLKNCILGLYKYKQANSNRLTSVLTADVPGLNNHADSTNISPSDLPCDEDDYDISVKGETSQKCAPSPSSSKIELADVGSTKSFSIEENGNEGQHEPSLLEKKMSMKSAKEKERAKLNRALLPYYTLPDVESFIAIFLKVDENFSGELNMNEWVKLFSIMHRNVTEMEARKIFYKIDKNSDGLIQLHELIPIVFPKADKKQLKLILAESNSNFCDIETKVSFLRADEIDELFNCYDFNKSNYVSVGYIRERVRLFQLKERVSYEFLESFATIKDEDMVNRNEFAKILKAYISKQ